MQTNFANVEGIEDTILDTFPDVFIPLNRERNTMSQAAARHPTNSHLIPPRSSNPELISRTWLLKQENSSKLKIAIFDLSWARVLTSPWYIVYSNGFYESVIQFYIEFKSTKGNSYNM